METTPLETLPFGPLTDRTVHLCIDMQNLFALDTPWHTPWMDRVLPVVARIAERHPARTVLTRFIPPERPDQMPGSWRRYYERWRDLTQERMDPGLMLGSLVIGSLPGIFFGSHLSARVPDNVLRPVLATILVIVGVRMLRA